MRLERRIAIAATLAAALAVPPLLVAPASSGPLEPFRKVFKEPADTLKGLVAPKARQAESPPPAVEAPAEDVATAAATPDPAPAPASAEDADSVAAAPVAPEDMPVPRPRPDAVADAGAPAGEDDEDEDPWAVFTEGPDAPPLDMSQHEDAIEALIASRSLGAVHKAANPPADAVTAEVEAIAGGRPLGYAAPGEDIDVEPRIRPNFAAAAPGTEPDGGQAVSIQGILRPRVASAMGSLDEERGNAVSGVLRPGGSCSRALTSLGVTAVSVDPIRSGSCGIAAPVEVAALGGGAVKLTTKAMVNCDVASTLAAFMRDTVDPLARRKLGGSVTDIRIAATYACRPRNNVKGAKLSEHAKGNAIDISAFKVKDEWIVVGGKNGLAANAFLKEVRKAACGPFTTVLGPGSDAYHSDHFHLDLAQRGKSGRGLYCR